MNKRICLWSCPRNVSTALMYSFAQRRDTKVFDEPLYAHYLLQSGVEHPARGEVLKFQENDGNKISNIFAFTHPSQDITKLTSKIKNELHFPTKKKRSQETKKRKIQLTGGEQMGKRIFLQHNKCLKI